MCGRFYLDAKADELVLTLNLSNISVLKPRYNIAPSQQILAAVSGKDGREGRWYRWGLIPPGPRILNLATERSMPGLRQWPRSRLFVPPFGVDEC